jgi:protein gp37
MYFGLRENAGRERRTLKQYQGVTEEVNGRQVWTGKVNIVRREHPAWGDLIDWRGVPHPLLGDGMPSLVFVCSESDPLHEQVPDAIISRVVSTFVLSDHIGLICTKRERRMREFFTAPRSPERLRRAQQHLWLGFSACGQPEFDQRWAEVRVLAEAGWTVFASIAPMIEPVVLPDSFLAFGDQVWAICSGEQPVEGRWRDMDPRWARRVRDACREAGVPFFFKQMAGKRPIPPDLLIREFPRVRREEASDD